jgi:hypothetical protein
VDQPDVTVAGQSGRELGMAGKGLLVPDLAARQSSCCRVGGSGVKSTPTVCQGSV